MSLKSKLKMAAGAIGLAIFGASSGYWVKEQRGYSKNVEVLLRPFNRVAIVGDTGQPGSIRASVIQKIKELDPDFLVLNGDLKYPTAIEDKKEFDIFVGPFLGAWKTIVTMGNHSQYLNEGWLQNNADKNGVEWKNYYHGKIFTDACVGFAESSFYDVILGSPDIQERQEKFLHKFFDDSRCSKLKRILIAHHTVYAYGSHRNDTKKGWKKLVQALPIHVLISGHDHQVSMTTVDGKQYYVFGSGSKQTECHEQPKNGFCDSRPAVGYLKDGVLKAEFVH